MIAVILGVFSSFLFYVVGQQFRTSDAFTETYEEYDIFSSMFLEEFKENLIMVDVFILFAFACVSYVLAGRTLRPIEVTMRQHEAFSGNVAHELRTPLAALYATTSATLRKPATPTEYIGTLEDIKHETKRLINLTERLLKTTRGEAVHVLESVPLDKLARSVVSKMEGLAASQNVHLTINTEELLITGDALKLEELLFNLIHNAIKFSHREGTVEVAVQKKGTVTITDHGIGISKEALPHVCERLYTSDSARDERGQHGTGLGLAIASQIVHEHHAKISLKSEEGKGTTVTVTFNL